MSTSINAEFIDCEKKGWVQVYQVVNEYDVMLESRNKL